MALEQESTAPPPAAPGAGGGRWWTKKYGPLALWVWMLLGLGAALAYSYWRSKTSATSDTDTGSSTSDLPNNVTPELVIQNYTESSPGSAPPVSTSPGVPTTPPAAPSGGTTTTKPPPSTPAPPPVKTPKPPSTPVPPVGSASTVTVAKFTTTDPVWNSTIAGIAKHEGFGSDWQKLWNFSGNAALKKRRGDPDKIQPGDKVAIPPK